MSLNSKTIDALSKGLSTDSSKNVVVLQAENPDADSLASALAFEDILERLDHTVHLICPVDIPKYLHYLQGWDRVTRDIPSKVDITIIVDTAQFSLLESVSKLQNYSSITSSSVFIVDHHMSGVDMPFETNDIISEHAAATGELIYEIATEVNWEVSDLAADMLAASIMSDTLGLTTMSTTARTVEVLSKLIALGANLPKSSESRRALMKKSVELTRYKGDLLQRIHFISEGKIAVIHIPWEEIEKYSDKYNPPMLVMDDMRLTEGVEIAIGIKTYPDGKITGKLRSNNDYPFCEKIAKSFGGGGHKYAAGFKVFDKDLDEVISEIEGIYKELR